MKKTELEITIKITEDKGIILCRSVILFGKPRYVAGLWNNSIVFTTLEPTTLKDAEALIYTTAELRDFAENGEIEGLVNIQ